MCTIILTHTKRHTHLVKEETDSGTQKRQREAKETNRGTNETHSGTQTRLMEAHKRDLRRRDTRARIASTAGVEPQRHAGQETQRHAGEETQRDTEACASPQRHADT